MIIGGCKFKEWFCDVHRETYYDSGGVVALQLRTHDEGLIATATVNIVGEKPLPDHVLIKNWSENEGILECLIDAGIISEPIGTVPVNFVKAHLCKLLV